MMTYQVVGTPVAAEAARRRSETRRALRDLLVIYAAVVACASLFYPALSIKAGPIGALALLFVAPSSYVRLRAHVWLLVALSLWSFLSVLWSIDPDTSLRLSITRTVCAVVVVYLVAVLRTRMHVLVVVYGYLVGCAIATVLLVLAKISGPEGQRIPFAADLNINYVAYALAAGLGLLVMVHRLHTGHRVRVVMPFTFAIVILLGIVVTGTRGALLSAAVLVLWLVVSSALRRPPLHLWWTAVVIAATVLVTGLFDQLTLLFESGSRSTGDWSGRLKVWPLARDAWIENPVLGVGAGAFETTNEMSIGAHNAILEIGASLGAVGVALFVAVVVSLLRVRGGLNSEQALVVGAFLSTTALSYLTGMWDLAIAGWIVLAVVASAVNVLRTPVVAELAPREGSAVAESTSLAGEVCRDH